jgi:hypothetical protein
LASDSGNTPTVEGTNFGSATSVTFTSGTSNAGAATLALYRAENPLIHVSDGSINSETAPGWGFAILVNPAATEIFWLNSPADITAGGDMAAYTVTRYDQYNNLVTSGAQTVYLYTNSTGDNADFYDAAAEGAIIDSVSIADEASTASFWYYDEKAGAWTIIAPTWKSRPTRLPASMLLRSTLRRSIPLLSTPSGHRMPGWISASPSTQQMHTATRSPASLILPTSATGPEP